MLKKYFNVLIGSEWSHHRHTLFLSVCCRHTLSRWKSLKSRHLMIRLHIAPLNLIWSRSLWNPRGFSAVWTFASNVKKMTSKHIKTNCRLLLALDAATVLGMSLVGVWNREGEPLLQQQHLRSGSVYLMVHFVRSKICLKVSSAGKCVGNLFFFLNRLSVFSEPLCITAILPK